MVTLDKLSTETFMQHLVDNKMLVWIYLKHGIKLVGKITGFDDEVIILTNNVSQIVYWHSVCTILPENSAKT